MKSAQNSTVQKFIVPVKATDLSLRLSHLQEEVDKGITSGFVLTADAPHEAYLPLGKAIVNSVLRFFRLPGKYTVVTVVRYWNTEYTEHGNSQAVLNRLMARNGLS